MMTTKMIKPYLEIEKKELIAKLNFLTGLTIKDICNDLLEHAVNSNYAMHVMSHFKRSVTINKLQYPASSNPIPFPEPPKNTTRITLIIDNKIHEYANSLYFATDVSVPKILASMIKFSINDKEFLDSYISECLSSKIDDERKRLLMSILDDVNAVDGKEHSVAALLIGISEEVSAFNETIEVGIEKLTSGWTAAQ